MLRKCNSSLVRRSHPKGYNLRNGATQSPTKRQGFKDLGEMRVRSTHHDVRTTAVGQGQEVRPRGEARHVQRVSATLPHHLSPNRQERPPLFVHTVNRPHHRPAHRGPSTPALQPRPLPIEPFQTTTDVPASWRRCTPRRGPFGPMQGRRTARRSNRRQEISCAQSSPNPTDPTFAFPCPIPLHTTCRSIVLRRSWKAKSWSSTSP